MVDDALRAIQFAHLCVLLVDATEELHKQDLAIARLIAEEGRAVVIGANKWDAVRDRQGAATPLMTGWKFHWRSCAACRWCMCQAFAAAAVQDDSCR